MRKPAFTFLELLIAVSLFTVGMVSALQIFPVNRRLLTQSANETQASFLAQEEIEDVRTAAYVDVSTGTYEPLHYVSTTGGAEFGQYQRQTTVSYIDSNYNTSSSDTGLKKVVVTVSWTEHNISRQYSLTTFKYTLDGL